MSDGADEETWIFNYQVEQREDGWWTRLCNTDGTPRERWIGPYPTSEKAHGEVKASLEAVLATIVKTNLGLK